ncbi:MAG: hypothetical protein M3Y50_09500, partial [Acidobacteriota bacterium]|nr:hypothetical protein [Acidobacteriota bacterium]
VGLGVWVGVGRRFGGLPGSGGGLWIGDGTGVGRRAGEWSESGLALREAHISESRYGAPELLVGVRVAGASEVATGWGGG